MPRIARPLSAKQVEHAKATIDEKTGKVTPLFLADGLAPGLYLIVSKDSARSWALRYLDAAGARRWHGLGSARVVTLVDARKRAIKARWELDEQGLDPIAAKRERRQASRSRARVPTFAKVAAMFIDAKGAEIGKSRNKWESTLATYAFPVFGEEPVDLIDTPLVLQVLSPIWNTKNETASRVRGRIESILDFAKTRGYRSGENPARWDGLPEHSLAKRSSVRKVEHHPAVPYAEMPALMAALRALDSVPARALEFATLTAVRTENALGAVWEEIDMAERTWTIPAERMKTGKQHRVPLSPAALKILEQIGAKESGLVFPGKGQNGALGDSALRNVLQQKLGRPETTHGLRSTFDDWASETTSHVKPVIDMALAHVISDKVDAAYRRGDLFEKRVRLMADWANYLDGIEAAVVPLRAAG